MGRAINSRFECEFCRKPVVATGGNQRTCLARSCKLKLRSLRFKQKLRKDRAENPHQCVWCEKPITEIGLRRYHPDCKAAKNRERVKEYNRTRKPTPGPKKPRIYKSTVKCEICKTEVRRTAARQYTCGEDECKRERKLNKARSQTLDQFRAEKERRFHAKNPLMNLAPQVYKVRS